MTETAAFLKYDVTANKNRNVVFSSPADVNSANRNYWRTSFARAFN